MTKQIVDKNLVYAVLFEDTLQIFELGNKLPMFTHVFKDLKFKEYDFICASEDFITIVQCNEDLTITVFQQLSNKQFKLTNKIIIPKHQVYVIIEINLKY